MALPTRPSNGPPTPRREPAPQKRESDALPSLPEISLPPAPKLRQQEPAREPVRKTEQQQAPVSQPKRRPKSTPQKERAAKEEIPTAETDDGWAIDKRTGKRYRKIPKTVMGDDGRPMLQLENFNLDDLTGEAETFLAHLRVAPDKEEQKRLRELKASMAKKQNAIYAKDNPDEEDAEDEDF